jgi:hypothetical protein
VDVLGSGFVQEQDNGFLQVEVDEEKERPALPTPIVHLPYRQILLRHDAKIRNEAKN